MILKPFFTYYGGKYLLSKYLPEPKYNSIIEPFGGSAGYSLRYSNKNILINEINPLLYNLWIYLTTIDSKTILNLPDIQNTDDIRDTKFNSLCEAEKTLIGFWLNKGSASPANKPSSWFKSKSRPNSYWGQKIKERIAGQLKYIKHWKIENKSFENLENQESTWFIDPPYQKAGIHYINNSEHIDYKVLGIYCKERKGQIIVCENEGADWLEFKKFREINSTVGKRKGFPKTSKEYLYTN